MAHENQCTYYLVPITYRNNNQIDLRSPSDSPRLLRASSSSWHTAPSKIHNINSYTCRRPNWAHATKLLPVNACVYSAVFPSFLPSRFSLSLRWPPSPFACAKEIQSDWKIINAKGVFHREGVRVREMNIDGPVAALPSSSDRSHYYYNRFMSRWIEARRVWVDSGKAGISGPEINEHVWGFAKKGDKEDAIR